MKIFVLELTGAGKLSHYTFCICHELVKKGNDVTLFTSKHYELDSLNKNFPVQKISRFYYFKLLRLTMSFRPDIINFQYLPNPLLDLFYLKYIKQLFGVKLVYTPHNILPHNKSFYYFTIFNKIYGLVDSIIVHSDFNRTVLRDLFSIDSARIKTAPVGNFNMLFHQSKYVSRNKARLETGLNKHHKVILFFGYINRDKGIDVLFQAFKIAREKVSHLKLIVAGEPGRDIRIDRLIEKADVSGDVITDLKYIPLKKAVLYFKASDVVILPYRKVCNTPLIQLAYSFGLPVIITKYCKEFVDDGKSGIITRPGDTKDLSDAIIKIFSQKNILHDMSQCARNLAVTDFSWDKITNKILADVG